MSDKPITGPRSDNDQHAQEEVARIKARITRLIEEHRNNGSGNMLLSLLGAKLGTDLGILEKITGLKLSQFIRKHVGLEIGITGPHNTVQFVVAAGSSAADPPPSAPRYLPRFWAAFATPQSDEKPRFIHLESLTFGPREDIPATTDSAIRPIAAEYIAPREASGSSAQTVARIERWLETQKLESDRFLAKRKRPRDARSLLDGILNALDGDQLKRVSLPLDIIKVLSEQKN